MNLKQWLADQETTVNSILNSPANEIFTESFMMHHTRYSDIQAFVDAFMEDSNETYIPLDDFVARNSDFSTWDNMSQAAVEAKLKGEDDI